MVTDKNTIINSMQTINDMVRYGASLLTHSELYYGHGYQNAIEESIQICMHSINLNFEDYKEFKQARLLEKEKEDILELIMDRCYTRKPLAYLIKKAPFHGLDFYIDERVIVPRSFIGELLVNDGLLPFLKQEPTRILDLCTGSACLPIIASHVFVDSTVDAVDISDDAIDVAKINIEKFNLKERIKLYKSNVYEGLGKEHFHQYDIIISNPPYVNANSMQSLPREYQQEPSIALHGGDDGMDIVREIIGKAKQYLKPTGILVIEIGNEYENLLQAFPKLSPTWLPVSVGEDQVFLLNAKDL
ncbi:MAG: putative methyltransferase [Pseudomonadota bacterium]|jgi:ribosomal protein L3 glutamine methyltransferase